ncbi:MAG: hypothetical protein IPI26_02485 [Elusimicrobia bacterium]|nr:hypothetical protein [Elusimicrobiota bacterium]
MPPRARIAIGAGALLIFIGFYFAAVERHRRDEGRRFFAAEGRRLADLWAARLADRWDDPSARDTLVRRLRAETDSRAAGLGDAEGVLVVLHGDMAGDPPPGSGDAPRDRPLSDGAWGFWSPVFVSGERVATLFWARDTAVLQRADRSARRAGIAAFLWGAGVILWSLFPLFRTPPSPR